MSRSTVSSRLTALEESVARIEALLTSGQPATSTKSEPKARRSSTAKTQPKAEKAICKATRKAFIAASEYDFSGWSTKEIVVACLENPALLPKGFVVGPRYTELYS